MLGIDFFGARPNPAAIKAAGYDVVFRYNRNTGPGEPEAYMAAGLGYIPIDETNGQEALGGASAGVRDGAAAAAYYRSIGLPAGMTVTVNLSDFAPTPDQVPAIQAYWRGYISQTQAWAVVPYDTGWLAEALNLPSWENAMNDNGVSGSTVVPQAVVYQRTSPTRPQIAGTNPGDYDEDVFLAPLTIWGLAPAPERKPPVNLPPLSGPIVCGVLRPQNDGYWLIGQDGGIFAFGKAPALPSLAGKLTPGHFARNAVASPSGLGLTVFGSDGGVFALGDAHFDGSLSGEVEPSKTPLEA